MTLIVVVFLYRDVNGRGVNREALTDVVFFIEVRSVVAFFIEVKLVAFTLKDALMVAVFFILTLKIVNFFKESLTVCEFNLGCSN